MKKKQNCNKITSDIINKFTQINQEIDDNNFSQNVTNMELDDIFTSGVRESKEDKKSLSQNISQIGKFIAQYLIAVLLENQLLDNK